MEKMMQQPVFAQETNRYREKRSEQYAGCFYYEMLPQQELWYIPLGGVDWLVEEKNGTVLTLEHRTQPVLLKPAGGLLFGFHLSADLQQTGRTEEFERWLSGSLRHQGFEQRCVYCERGLKRELPVKSVHVLLQAMLTQLTEKKLQPPIEAIAAGGKYSNRQLERLCKETFGCSPKRLSQMYRLYYVLQALGTMQDDTYTDLAVSYGYTDASHMLRDFKRFMGCNPKCFTKQFLS